LTVIEPNAHYALYESRGREPDQDEQDWLRAEQDEQDWLRTEQEILTLPRKRLIASAPTALRLKEALEGHHPWIV
jgi:hypothetical protein